MTMAGGSDPKQVEHDNSADRGHIELKQELKKRRGTYVFIPHDGALDFTNDFSVIPLEDAPFFLCGTIPTVQHDGIEPEEWDRAGAMAAYSAGSEVAELRRFKRDQGTQRRGPKRKNFDDLMVDADEEALQLPPPPGDFKVRGLRMDKVPWEDYRSNLLEVRVAAKHIKRRGYGEDGRGQWKITPISVQTILDEGEADATLLDSSGVKEANRLVDITESGGSLVKTRKTKLPHDLRRYTVNSHPALARALAKVLKKGEQAEIMGFMDETLPSVIHKFEKVTGRLVIGASIHWDSNLPHWNLWHVGLEKVIYRKGKGADRVRFRRTAMNLGSSGPGLRAWRRVELAFARLGRDFCPYTAAELRKEEERLMKAQGRMPGDWAINQVADEVLEEYLVDAGYKREVEEGFREFVDNEDARYAAGMAGRLALEDRREMAEEISRLRDEAAHIESLNDTIELLKLDAVKERTVGEELTTKLEMATARVEEIQLEVAELQAQAGTDAGSRQELNVRIAELEGEVEGVRNQLVQAEAAKKKVASKFEETKVKRDGLKNDVVRLKKELSGEQADKKKLEKEAADNESRIKKLEKTEAFWKLMRPLISEVLQFLLGLDAVMAALRDHPNVEKKVSELAFLVGVDMPSFNEPNKPDEDTLEMEQFVEPPNESGEGRADPSVDGTKEGSPTEPEGPT